jgi:uncharacterized protein YggE
MDLSSSLRLLAFSILGFASLLLGPAPATADDQDDTPKRFISLSGTGAIKTTPDKVDISTGVTSQAPTAKEALAKNTAAMANVIDTLKSQGLDPKDIQTTNFSVQPLYEERKEGRSPAIIGYQVTNSVRITVRDIGRLGAILDEVVSLGANDVGSIEFGVAEPEAMKDEARKLAVANAIANAKIYADTAGVKLGKVLTISEEEGGYVARYAAPAPMEMSAKAVPIEAGTTTVETRVRVTFELE